MNNLYSNNYPVINLYKRTSLKSEVVTQLLYGETFKCIDNKKHWIKIKNDTKETAAQFAFARTRKASIKTIKKMGIENDNKKIELAPILIFLNLIIK